MMDFLKGTVTTRDWIAVAGIIGLAAALAAAFVFLVHTKQREDIDQIRADDALVMADLEHAIDLKNKIEDLRTKTASIEKLVHEFEERLPSKREIPTLLREFEYMAAEEDLDVELSPLSRMKDERKETIPYKIVARGGFHQIASFINRLERFKRYLKISNLDIGASEGGISVAKFTLNTYRFLQQPLTKPAPPEGATSK